MPAPDKRRITLLSGVWSGCDVVIPAQGCWALWGAAQCGWSAADVCLTRVDIEGYGGTATGHSLLPSTATTTQLYSADTRR